MVERPTMRIADFLERVRKRDAGVGMEAPKQTPATQAPTHFPEDLEPEEEEALEPEEKERAQAADSMAEFRGTLPILTDWRQLLQLEYPQVPPHVVSTHVVYNKAQSQPPLELLCPPAGHKVESWDPDIFHWPFESPSGRAVRGVSTDYLVPLGPLTVGSAILFPFQDRCSFWQVRTVGMCRPEGVVVEMGSHGTRPVRAVIILDMVRLPENLDVLLNRLFHYLELTGAMYGAATCYSSTWLCKRKDPGSRVLQVSPPHDRLGMAIGFLAYKSLADLPRETVPAQPVASFDMTPALDLLKQACDKLQVEHKDKILSEADVSGAFQLEDLENVEPLDFGWEKDSIRKKPRALLRAQYRGKKVVVKTRDLTSPYYIGFAGLLATFVREVDASFTLKHIHRRFVPKLLSWGFLSGAMFVYTITEDAGISTTAAEMAGDRKLLRDPERVAALPAAFEALHEIHKRGLLHGDINKDALVTRKDDAGKWTVMLVGFGQSSRVEVFSKEWSEGTRKENAELQEVMEIEKCALALKNKTPC